MFAGKAVDLTGLLLWWFSKARQKYPCKRVENKCPFLGFLCLLVHKWLRQRERRLPYRRRKGCLRILQEQGRSRWKWNPRGEACVPFSSGPQTVFIPRFFGGTFEQYTSQRLHQQNIDVSPVTYICALTNKTDHRSEKKTVEYWKSYFVMRLLRLLSISGILDGMNRAVPPF